MWSRLWLRDGVGDLSTVDHPVDFFAQAVRCRFTRARCVRELTALAGELQTTHAANERICSVALFIATDTACAIVAVE